MNEEADRRLGIYRRTGRASPARGWFMALEEALPQHGIPVGAASIYYMRVGFPNHHRHSTVLSRGPFPSGHFGDDDLLPTLWFVAHRGPDDHRRGRP